jgi:phosphoribosylglycinamide formyltransferase-1
LKEGQLMINIGVLVSGNGTNLQALIDAINNKIIQNGQITTVISSCSNAYALKRAEENGIPNTVITRRDYSDLETYDNKLIEQLEYYNVDLVVMAGFLSIVGKHFIDKYPNKIINVHPSLIPSFCGKGYYGIRVHEEVLKRGVKITGATIHFVNEIADEDPIILQKAVMVMDNDTPLILQKRVMEEAEWIILPQAISLFCEDKIKVKSNKVLIKN